MPSIMAGTGNVRGFPIEIDIKPFLINADLLKVSTFRLARQLGDMRWPLTQSVKLVVIPSMETNIAMSGRPPFRPLELDTVIKKFVAGVQPFYVGIPLIGINERLLDAVENFNIWRITRDSADMDAMDRIVPYAKYHQQGTKHVPQRQFALLHEKDIERILVIFDSWIRKTTSVKDFWPYQHKEF